MGHHHHQWDTAAGPRPPPAQASLLIMLTSLAPSPMAKVTAFLCFFTSCTIKAFCLGVTLQQITAWQLLASSTKAFSTSPAWSCEASAPSQHSHRHGHPFFSFSTSPAWSILSLGESTRGRDHRVLRALSPSAMPQKSDSGLLQVHHRAGAVTMSPVCPSMTTSDHHPEHWAALLKAPQHQMLGARLFSPPFTPQPQTGFSHLSGATQDSDSTRAGTTSRQGAENSIQVPPYQEVPADDDSSLVARSLWALLGEVVAARGVPTATEVVVALPVSLEDLAVGGRDMSWGHWECW